MDFLLNCKKKVNLFYFFLDHIESPNMTSDIFPQAETCVYVGEYKDHALILDELLYFLI